MSLVNCHKNLRRIIVGMLVLGFAFVSANAVSAQSLKLRIETGPATLNLQDNTAPDASPILGVLSWTGTVGGYTLEVLTSLSKPAIGDPNDAQVDLQVLVLKVAGADPITITATDSGFPVSINFVGPATLTSKIGGLTANPPSPTVQAYLDPSNTPFGMGPTACTTGAQSATTSPSFDSTKTINCPVNGPFSLTLSATGMLAAGRRFSFDFFVEATTPKCGAIGDYVWNDKNGDGVQVPGEPGINDVPVKLYDSTGTIVLATTTTGNHPLGGAQGYYQFPNVCAGTYKVDVDQNSPPLIGLLLSPTNQGTPATDSNPDPATVVLLVNGDADQTIDFGYYSCGGEIGDFVWHDLNRDGIQDAGEPGIEGVTVQLLDAAGTTVLRSEITAGGGLYKFTGLCGGSYKVEVLESTVPAGYTRSPEGTGTPSTDSGPHPVPVTLAGDFDSDLDNDFGYLSPCTGMIGNYVWYDANQNGIQDPTEVGIDNVQVKLMDSTGFVLLKTETTGLNPSDASLHGYYAFTGVCAGTYKVVVVPATVPPQYTGPTTPGAGTPSNDSNAIPATVILTTDASTDDTIDFGYISPCTGKIGDFVWLDENHDGIQDAGEPGLVGVVVNLLKASDSSQLQSVPTGAGGAYLFSGLCPGDYKVEVVPPAGMTASPEGAGTSATDSNPNPSLVNLPLDNSSDLSIDFGFYCTGSIGDFVWNDLNANGIQDGGEPGIDGLTVSLYIGANPVPMTTTTGPNGFYTFGGLCGGSYTVVVPTPAGYMPSPQVPGFPGTDSNGSPAFVNLPGNNSSDPTIDFGFYQPPLLTCKVGLTKQCAIVPPPVTQSFVCADAKPIDSLTMIWNGSQNVDIKAWKGAVGSTALPKVFNVAPGQEVTITGFAGSPNDVVWEIFAAGTLTKLGNSDFHLSCSDVDMNGPEDCGKVQGDAKGLLGFLNLWTFEGMGGNGKVLDCTPAPPVLNWQDSCSITPQAEPSCTTEGKPTSLTFKYDPKACYTNNNNLQSGKYICTGTKPGSPVTITSTTAGLVISPNSVTAGQEFTVTGTFGTQTLFNLTSAAGNQSLSIHTSCSQLLEVGNTFDSFTLVGFNGHSGGTQVKYRYVVKNDSNGTLAYDLVDKVGGNTVNQYLGQSLGVGATQTFEDFVATLNATTTNVATVTGSVGPLPNQFCQATDSVIVSVPPPDPCSSLSMTATKLDRTLQLTILNSGPADVVLSDFQLTWPASIGKLIQVNLDGDVVYTTPDIPATSAHLTSAQLAAASSATKRTIQKGTSDVLKVDFEKDVTKILTDYTGSFTFGGCTLKLN